VSGIESFADDHRRATGFAQVNTSSRVLDVGTVVAYLGWYLQQFTSPGQVFAADLVGEQSIVAVHKIQCCCRAMEIVSLRWVGDK